MGARRLARFTICRVFEMPNDSHQVTAQYSAAIRAARNVGDHQTANQLAQRQRDELREVMA